MMSDTQGYVLDASAVLALLNQEPGAERVEQMLLASSACISSVQWAEVTAKLITAGVPPKQAQEIMAALAIPVVVFDEKIAFESSCLAPLTKVLGLSLGDRVCLATGIVLGMPVLTADKIWLKLAGQLTVAIESIR